MTLLPPEYHGGRRRFDNPSWRERNGERLIIAVGAAGALILAVSAYFIVNGGDNQSTTSPVTTTAQPEKPLAPTQPATTTTETSVTPLPSTETAETPPTFDPFITECVANFDEPQYADQRQVTVANALRDYEAEHGGPPDDPAFVIRNAYIKHCQFLKDVGVKNPG